MQKRLNFIAALGLAVTLAMPAQAQDANTVVATVNGTEITVGHMILARATIPEQYQQLPDDVLFEGILKQLVQQTLLAGDFSGDLPKRIALSLENEERSLIAGERVEALLSEALTNEALQEAYTLRFADAVPAQEYNAAHILVETEEEALAIKADLEGGANFATTAKEKSTGPSGPDGGSLGWFGQGAMVPSFEEAVVGLDVGAVSAPVQTKFGWHLIILNETRNGSAPTLDKVRSELEEEIRQAAMAAVIDALTEKAEIDQTGAEGIDPSILSDLSIVE
jgi:peptidyl-prolyl cis-trans isomerase C|tara:strand:- start:2143 stop:2982 length:840 start_codon:yes stop_codon:yes gene_type:complete